MKDHFKIEIVKISVYLKSVWDNRSKVEYHFEFFRRKKNVKFIEIWTITKITRSANYFIRRFTFDLNYIIKKCLRWSFHSKVELFWRKKKSIEIWTTIKIIPSANYFIRRFFPFIITLMLHILISQNRISHSVDAM